MDKGEKQSYWEQVKYLPKGELQSEVEGGCEPTTHTHTHSPPSAFAVRPPTPTLLYVFCLQGRIQLVGNVE